MIFNVISRSSLSLALLASESNLVELLYQLTYIFMKFILLQIVTKVYTGPGMNLNFLFIDFNGVLGTDYLISGGGGAGIFLHDKLFFFSLFAEQDIVFKIKITH